MFRSSTASSMLFLRFSIRESSSSDHHSGYGFVLAKTSVIWLVPESDLEVRRLCPPLPRGARDIDDGAMGSTCTMWLHDCTMALMREVLPTPESPAISTFSRPMALPVSVKGRRLGILMLGMMSWGALPLSTMSAGAPVAGLSASPLPSTLRTWLCMRSSENDPANEFLLDETLLIADMGPGVPNMSGVMGCDRLEAPQVRMHDGDSGLDAMLRTSSS